MRLRVTASGVQLSVWSGKVTLKKLTFEQHETYSLPNIGYTFPDSRFAPLPYQNFNLAGNRCP